MTLLVEILAAVVMTISKTNNNKIPHSNGKSSLLRRPLTIRCSAEGASRLHAGALKFKWLTFSTIFYRKTVFLTSLGTQLQNFFLNVRNVLDKRLFPTIRCISAPVRKIVEDKILNVFVKFSHPLNFFILHTSYNFIQHIDICKRRERLKSKFCICCRYITHGATCSLYKSVSHWRSSVLTKKLHLQLHTSSEWRDNKHIEGCSLVTWNQKLTFFCLTLKPCVLEQCNTVYQPKLIIHTVINSTVLSVSFCGDVGEERLNTVDGSTSIQKVQDYPGGTFDKPLLHCQVSPLAGLCLVRF